MNKYLAGLVYLGVAVISTFAFKLDVYQVFILLMSCVAVAGVSFALGWDWGIGPRGAE